MKYVSMLLLYYIVGFNGFFWLVCEMMTLRLYWEGDGTGKAPIASTVIRMAHGKRLASTVGPFTLGALTVGLLMVQLRMDFLPAAFYALMAFWGSWGATRVRVLLKAIDELELPETEPRDILWEEDITGPAK